MICLLNTKTVDLAHSGILPSVTRMWSWVQATLCISPFSLSFPVAWGSWGPSDPLWWCPESSCCAGGPGVGGMLEEDEHGEFIFVFIRTIVYLLLFHFDKLPIFFLPASCRASRTAGQLKITLHFSHFCLLLCASSDITCKIITLHALLPCDFTSVDFRYLL